MSKMGNFRRYSNKGIKCHVRYKKGSKVAKWLFRAGVLLIMYGGTFMMMDGILSRM